MRLQHIIYSLINVCTTCSYCNCVSHSKHPVAKAVAQTECLLLIEYSRESESAIVVCVFFCKREPVLFIFYRHLTRNKYIAIVAMMVM